MAARGATDRMEAKGRWNTCELLLQERVYQDFVQISLDSTTCYRAFAEEPDRVKLIDATATVEEVFEKTVEQVRAYGLDISQEAVAAALAKEAE